jgi:AAA family ATP:ADP antiporter
LDVRPGEVRAVAYTFLYVAIAVASFLLAKPIRNGLFLAEFGPYRLVYVYVAVPLVLSLFVPLYQTLAVRVGQRAVITGSLGFLCLNVLAFWWGFAHHPAPWMAARSTSGSTVMDACQPGRSPTPSSTLAARRLFGLIGSGASLGAVVGGLLAQFLVGAVGGTINLLLVLAVLILLAAGVVNAGWSVRRKDATGRSARRGRVPLASTLGLIARTRYLRSLAAVVFIVAVVTQWTRFQFNVAVAGACRRHRCLTRFRHVQLLDGIGASSSDPRHRPLLRRFSIAVTIHLPLALGVVGLISSSPPSGPCC